MNRVPFVSTGSSRSGLTQMRRLQLLEKTLWHGGFEKTQLSTYGAFKLPPRNMKMRKKNGMVGWSGGRPTRPRALLLLVESAKLYTHKRNRFHSSSFFSILILFVHFFKCCCCCYFVIYPIEPFESKCCHSPHIVRVKCVA